MFAICQVQGMWMVAKDNLRKKTQQWKAKGKLELLQVIDQCHAAFSVLCWSDKLCGFSPNAEEDLESLALYTSDKWLKGAYANQMLNLLQTNLVSLQILIGIIGLQWFLTFERERYGLGTHLAGWREHM